MKKITIIAVFLGFLLSSCVYMLPVIDYSYPHAGTSNNASIVVKDYESLGIITVKSSEIIDGFGNHTGSKITNEMLMLEAQKLGADDIINIRIDINEVKDFSADGKPFKTTFNYTATALAIKYTRGFAPVNEVRPSPATGSTNALVSSDRQSSDRLFSNAGANNWLSIGYTMAGVGLRYEYKLNPNLSLGADGYFQAFGNSKGGFTETFEFGVDFTARYYLLGGIFYVGAGLGIHGNYEYREIYNNNENNSGYDYDYYDWESDYPIGVALSPEIGVKINFGSQRGYFMDIGLKMPIITNDWGTHVNIVPYIGFAGIAF